MARSKKIVLLGHFGVGKTSLVRRYVDSLFSEDYLVTVGVHVKKKDIDLNGETISLIIWDIEGNSAISKARKSYLLGSHGFIYVFDVTRPETFENIGAEIAYLKKEYSNVPFSIAGNKVDLMQAQSLKDFFEKEEFKDCIFTSAKEGENVEKIFFDIAKQMI